MARAKCQWCKKEVDTKTAHREVVDGKNKYWCNDNCYEAYETDREKQVKIKAEYDEIYEITKEIFGYAFAGYSLLKREVVGWEKIGNRQKIIAYLKENKAWLSDVMRKSFESDFNRVRYYSVIVAGKLHDWKPKVEVEKTIIVQGGNFELFEPVPIVKLSDNEQVLYDVEDDLI